MLPSCCWNMSILFLCIWYLGPIPQSTASLQRGTRNYNYHPLMITFLWCGTPSYTICLHPYGAELCDASFMLLKYFHPISLNLIGPIPPSTAPLQITTNCNYHLLMTPFHFCWAFLRRSCLFSNSWWCAVAVVVDKPSKWVIHQWHRHQQKRGNRWYFSTGLG